MLLITILQSIFLPPYVYALTTGPHQPEYTAYESADAKDMVNLMTGDFSYTLPVLEVPGAEGGFSLPLAYNAGVGLEQEASWVGLGWNINAGAITRAINEFPDDAAGESQVVTVQDLTGVRGWSSGLLGLGQIGWNTQQGHYGAVSIFGIINFDYNNNGLTSGGLIGVNVGGGNVGFNAQQFAMAVITIVTWGAGSAASAGTGAATSATAAGGATKAASLATNIATDFAIGAIGSAFSKNAPNAPTAGYWKYSRKVKQKVLHKQYKIWLDKSRREKMYGALYLGKSSLTPVVNASDEGVMNLYLKNANVTETLQQFEKTSSINEGSASDINCDASGGEYHELNNPAFLATDQYSVKAAGISGNITPYRLDVGSVSMPREMTKKHVRYAPVPYMDYKVPFIYDGSPSNRYFNHVGGASAVSTPTSYSGMTFSVGNSNPSSNTSLTLNLNDVVLKNQRIRADIDGQKKIPQASHVEWLSNAEIKASTTYPSKFMDVLPASNRNLFRSNFTLGTTAITSHYTTSVANFNGNFTIPSNLSPYFLPGTSLSIDITYSLNEQYTFFETFDATINSVSGTTITLAPLSVNLDEVYGHNVELLIRYNSFPQIQNSIGGYVITSPEGITYHFALPVYDYDLRTSIVDATDPNKRSFITRGTPFANTWLLTAITGPDFIDHNSNGMVDDADWGYWVKFNYGKHTDSYKWRIPYEGNKRSADNKFDTNTEGKKQLYYLNTIETRSHVALFFKSVRSDSKDFGQVNSALKLDEICLITKEHYYKLGLNMYSSQIEQLLLTPSTTVRNFVNKQCLSRVLFNYTYDLCKYTPNSTASTGGKLTLQSISFKGRNDMRTVPDYKFEYAYNPSYDEDNWDGFGYYNMYGGASSSSAHAAYQSDINNGNAWSLSKVITPLGSTVEVNYERDSYSSILGNRMYGSTSYYFNSSNDANSTDPRYSRKIVVNHGGTIAAGDRIKLQGSLEYYCGVVNNGSTQTTFGNGGEYNVTHVGGNTITLAENFLSNVSTCEPLTYVSFVGNIQEVLINKKGGDLRVASILLKDEWGAENKIRYLYNTTTNESSGVITKEPEFIRDPDATTDNALYPAMPVIYGRVTVLTGKLTTDNDFHTRQVYEFETPVYGHIVSSVSTIKAKTLMSEEFVPYYIMKGYGEAYMHTITDKSSKIGSLKKITTYNKAGTEVSKTEMFYTDQLLNDGVNNYQGFYTEGNIRYERVESQNAHSLYHKLNRTTVIQHPYTLQRVVNYKDGMTTETKNLSWDLITGSVLAKVEKSNLGVYVKSITKPAYLIPEYAAMGSKAVNINNFNMLTQNAANYSYNSDAQGSSLGLLGATVQTWKKYGSVWRLGSSYAWKGRIDKLNTDGSHQFTSADDFNFSNTLTNPLWQFGGEVTFYDEYGMPLQTRDYNDIYSAVRMGYENKLKVAEAFNAKIAEMTFTSAEDHNVSYPSIGKSSGVMLNDGVVLRKSKGQLTGANTGDALITEPHTGDALVALSTGTTMVYSPFGLTPNRIYKASVWTNSTNGRIFYKLNGGAEQLSPAPTQADKAGKWYRINLEIPIGSSFTSLDVGVKSYNGSKIVFDDFRFQPADAIMTCYVYNPFDFEYPAGNYNSYSWVLDNDNIYTKFEESPDGLIQKTYRESIQYNGEKLVTESEKFYKKFITN